MPGNNIKVDFYGFKWQQIRKSIGREMVSHAARCAVDCEPEENAQYVPNAKPRNSGVALRYELLPPNLVMRALQLQPTKIENHNCSIAHVAEIRKPMGWSGNQLKRARASSSAPS